MSESGGGGGGGQLSGESTTRPLRSAKVLCVFVRRCASRHIDFLSLSGGGGGGGRGGAHLAAAARARCPTIYRLDGQTDGRRNTKQAGTAG